MRAGDDFMPAMKPKRKCQAAIIAAPPQLGEDDPGRSVPAWRHEIGCLRRHIWTQSIKPKCGQHFSELKKCRGFSEHRI
jgi:hypothetical protein